MSNNTTDTNRAYILMLVVALVTIMFLLKGNIHFNWADEGHLWYGVIETSKGSIPVQHFRSYDPGRYYWAAGWTKILGSGILSLRLANTIFQFVGLALGMIAVRKVIDNKWILAFIAGLLAIWMYPWYKYYEHGLVLAAIFFALLLIEKPSINRHLFGGIFVGITAFFSRNYGVYFFLSFLCLIFFIWFKIENNFLVKKIGVWSVGIVVGYLPMLAMFILIPGFFTSFIDSILLIFSPGDPVLPTPINWPWVVDISLPISLAELRAISISFTFLLVPIFYLFSIIYIFSSMKDASTSGAQLFIVSVFVGIPLMHHASVRSDLAHLAQSINPFLVALIALPFALKLTWNKWLVSSLTIFILILTFSIIIPVEAIPIVNKMNALNFSKSNIVKCKLLKDSVWIQKSQANYINLIRQFTNENIGPDENILIAPYEPGLYPILERTSPIWDPYPLFPVARERQKAIIQSLEHNNVTWALISNRPMDEMDKRRFSNTHKMVWHYLMDNFDLIDLPGLPQDRLLMHRRRPKAAP